MDKLEQLRQIIQSSKVSEELKTKQLAILDNPVLSLPEIKMALAQLIGEEVDAKIEELAVTELANDPELMSLEQQVDTAAAAAEADLEADLKLIDESMDGIKAVAEEIQKMAIQESLN